MIGKIDPKCFKGISRFVSSDGFLYPCCFVYTQKQDIIDWAEKNGYDLKDINLKYHTHDEIVNSDFMKEFNSRFDIDTCTYQCGNSSYQSALPGQPKWESYQKPTDK